ncbi:MAG TPA: glycine betaine ABC transporter substrate-binding protein [Candidatus Limnocylindria bacterium]|nr:glycine betaine ABC transporter substrate-binding protein [Candidatus Limnocylindria bacterium]
MRGFRKLALGASAIALALSACSTGGGSATIKIGSDGFDEARVVAEIYAQALEAKGFTVDRAGIGLGARAVTKAALESNQINLKPEYIGSGLVAGYGGESTSNSDTNLQRLQEKLTPLNITVLNYTPAQDTNAFVVRKETADLYKLVKMSDVTAVQDELKWALATDCPTNPICAAALKSAYGIEQPDATLLDACSGPMADALLNKTVDVAELCSTGPEITTNGWVVLEDDKQTQPADNLAPLVRNDLLAGLDQAKFKQTLNDVSAKIDTKTLAQLYYDVSVNKKDLKDVASAWLKAVGLVS